MKEVEIKVSGNNPGEPVSFHIENKRGDGGWARERVVDLSVGKAGEPVVQRFSLRDDQRLVMISPERRVRYDRDQNAAVPMTAKEIREADEAAAASAGSGMTDEEATKDRLKMIEQERRELEKYNKEPIPRPSAPSSPSGHTVKQPVPPVVPRQASAPSTTQTTQPPRAPMPASRSAAPPKSPDVGAPSPSQGGSPPTSVQPPSQAQPPQSPATSQPTDTSAPGTPPGGLNNPMKGTKD